MSKHWQEAQEAARKTGWGNFVSTADQDAWIVGSTECSWIIFSCHRKLQLVAKTVQGVDMVLEELDLPHLGWQ